MGWQIGERKLSVYLAEGGGNASNEAGSLLSRTRPGCDQELAAFSCAKSRLWQSSCFRRIVHLLERTGAFFEAKPARNTGFSFNENIARRRSLGKSQKLEAADGTAWTRGGRCRNCRGSRS